MSKSKHLHFSPQSQAWRLTVTFYSPCIYYTPVMLDGLVAYGLNRRATAAEGRPSYTGPGWKRTGIFDDLKRYLFQDSNCSVCTQMIPDIDIPIIESIKKRFDLRHYKLIDFGKHRPRINSSAAPYRNYNKRMPGRLVRQGHWDFIGDGPAIAALISSEIVGIGKDINAGYGWIARANLLAVTATREEILAQRPIPLHLAERYGIEGRHEIRAWKPPYWRRGNQTECVVPE